MGCFLIVVACIVIAILAYAFEIVILLAMAVGLFFLFRTIIRDFTSELLFEGVSMFLWGITIFCAVYVYALNFRFSYLIPERCNYVTYLKEKSEYFSNSSDEITFFLFNHNHSPVYKTEFNDAKKDDQRTNLYLDFYVGMRYFDFQNKYSSYIASGYYSFKFMEDKSFSLEGLFSDNRLFGVRLRTMEIFGSEEINDMIDKIKRKYGEYQFTHRNHDHKEKSKARGKHYYDFYQYYYTCYEYLWKAGNKNILLYYEVGDRDEYEVYLYIYDSLIYDQISDKLKAEQSIKEKKQRELDLLEKQKEVEKQKEAERQKEIEYKKQQKMINNMQNDF